MSSAEQGSKVAMAPSGFRAFLKPRMLLIVWGAVGAAGLAYILLASSLQRADRPGAGVFDAAGVARPMRDPKLLIGEMSDFAYAFTERRAPATTFNDDDEGAPTSLRDFNGAVTLVNFWATWCAPCKRELPSLAELQRRRGGADFRVVAVAADPRGRAPAAAMLDEIGAASLDLYMDQRLALASAVGGQAALPLSILYDADGAEVGRLLGEADWAAPESLALIDRVLNQRAEGR